MKITTPAAAYSRVPSMPLKALDESAALPAGPVTYTARPGEPPAMCLILSTAVAARVPAVGAEVEGDDDLARPGRRATRPGR